MKTSSVALVLAGFVIGLVVSQSGDQLVPDAEGAGGKFESLSNY